MKDFKQTPKMKAEGSHYCGGGKVKKYADGGDVDLNAYVRKTAGLPPSKNTAAAPSAPVKETPYTGPNVDLNAYVRKTAGLPPSKNAAAAPSAPVKETPYTGPNVDLNKIVKEATFKDRKSVV
jgi:hypothetical protein